MQFIWAFVLSLVLVIVFKLSLWGLVLGIFLGPVLYNLFNAIAPIREAGDRTLYLNITFEVLGHLSKAKGTVTEDDIKMAERFMDTLQLRREARVIARKSFNLGKARDYPLRQRLRQLYVSYRNQRSILSLFCEHLIQASLNDGQLCQSEQKILYAIADELHISKARMEMYIQMIMASYYFHHRGNDQQGYQRKAGYHRQSHSERSNITQAYRVLGVTPDAEIITVKRAYRKLMNEHHPDKLISRGLPEEMLIAAKQRAQEIQSAYDLIKGDRGFK